jgi:dCMP deaminase
MKQKFIDYFMKIAETTSELSYAKRLQVGAVLVKDRQIISSGYNGMPTGWDNDCEDVEECYEVRDTYFSTDWTYNSDTKKYSRLKTKPEVLHAEMNCISKVARSTLSSEGATMFCTHAPCMNCAKFIYQAGITTLYFKNHYGDEQGVNFLSRSGVNVYYYSPN